MKKQSSLLSAVLLAASMLLTACTTGQVSSIQTSIESKAGSSSLSPTFVIDKNAYPDVLLTEELPFHQFFEPNYYREYYAWVQGDSKTLVLPSHPDELGRD